MNSSTLNGNYSKSDRTIRGIILAVLAVMTILRTVIQFHAGWIFVVDAGYDDALTVNMAKYIQAGEWLGPYNKFTLCKSVGYSLFLMVCNRTHLPYPAGFVLLMAASSAAFVASFRPFFRTIIVCGAACGKNGRENDGKEETGEAKTGKKVTREAKAAEKTEKEPAAWLLPIIEGILYLLLLYNPVGFGSISAMRIYRTSITAWAALLVVSGYAGLFFRRKEKIRRLLPWSLLAAFSLAYFWNLREDSVWIMPFAAVMTLLVFPSCLASFEGNRRKKDHGKRILLTLLPLCLTAVSALGIAARNYKDYGIFTTNDRTRGKLAEVGSLLLDIDDGEEEDPNIFVTDRGLEIAMANSPSLTKLRDSMLPAWDAWSDDSGQVPGDHFYWAIRDGMEAAGYYQGNGWETNEIYTRIANELKEAFEQGKISRRSGIALSSQCRHFTPDDIRNAFVQASGISDGMQRYQSCEMGGIDVIDTLDQAGIWEDYLRMKVRNLTEEETNRNLSWQSRANRITFRYQKSANFVKWLALAGGILALAEFIAELIRKRRKGSGKIRKKVKISGETLLIAFGIGLSAYELNVICYLFASWLGGDYSYYLYGATGHLFFAACKYLLILLGLGTLTRVIRILKRK